jgi:hypothetical protein
VAAQRTRVSRGSAPAWQIAALEDAGVSFRTARAVALAGAGVGRGKERNTFL